jgi:hypothetical protein
MYLEAPSKSIQTNAIPVTSSTKFNHLWKTRAFLPLSEPHAIEIDSSGGEEESETTTLSLGNVEEDEDDLENSAYSFVQIKLKKKKKKCRDCCFFLFPFLAIISFIYAIFITYNLRIVQKPMDTSFISDMFRKDLFI